MTTDKEIQEFNPEPELITPENSFNVANEVDRKIIEDSLKTTESSGSNYNPTIITLIFEDVEKLDALLDRLNLAGMDFNGEDFVQALVNDVRATVLEDIEESQRDVVEVSGEEFTKLLPDVVPLDLDELLKIREKNESNERVRFLLGRTRKELKEYRS